MDGFGLERHWDMKSWLRNDSVYQSIMSGALMIVFLAALSASHWPQLSVVAGLITAVVVGIVAVVYWAAVVCGDDDRADAERQSDVSVKQQETERDQKPVAGTRRAPLQRQEIFEEYWTRYTDIVKQLQDAKRIQDQRVALRQDAFVRDLQDAWVSYLGYAETSDVLRNWLVHQPHHGSRLIVGAGASLKSHRRAYETGEKVVVMVGSVRIEIQEDDPNKTTTIHITSPETIVTKVAVQEARRDLPEPETVSQSKPGATIH
jgi:hypothetical protein